MAAAQTGADALVALRKEARTAVALLGQLRTPTSVAVAQTGAGAPSVLLVEARTAAALLEEARTATVADGSMESAAFTGSVPLSPRIGTVVTTGSRLLSGTLVPAVGGLPSLRPTTSSGLR